MKTLQIGLEWFPERAGGLPRYYYDFIKTAGQAGVEVQGLLLGSDKIEPETNGAIRPVAFGTENLAKKIFAGRREIAKSIKAYQPDLIVSHFAMLTYGGLSLIKKPLIVHFHGPWASESAIEGGGKLGMAVKKHIEASVYHKAKRLIVLSKAFGDILVKDFNISPSKITVIPGGVDFPRFNQEITKEAARKTLNWPQDRPILLTVRRLVERMGLDVLVEAMASVVAKHPDVLLLMAGKGPMQESLTNQIAAAGLQDNIRLIGFLPDELLPTAYKAADMSIVPTQALEGFGLIALESLASGTPCLVTPVGGLPEAVGGLDPNLIFEAPTKEAIAQKLNNVLGTGNLPTAEQCKAYARNFDWPIISRRISAVYAREMV